MSDKNNNNNETKNQHQHNTNETLHHAFVRTTSTLKQISQGLNLPEENEVMQLIRENEEMISKFK